MANAHRQGASCRAALNGRGLLLALALCPLPLALWSCSGPPGAGRLGADLGGFQVQASEVANGCGAGALGSRPSFDFEIDLAREQSELFWGRESSALLDRELRFELLANVNVELTPARGNQPGCSVGRSDRIAGTLTPSDVGEIVGFTARMEYGFELAPGVQCSLDDRLAAGLPQLPCSMSYDLVGQRSREPELE